MRIGIGIDTGGTCTDAVVYNFEEKRILASAKASTTREDLSVGIEEAISKLPESLRAQAKQLPFQQHLRPTHVWRTKAAEASGRLIISLRILLKFLSAHQLDLLSVVNQVFLKQVRCIQ